MFNNLGTPSSELQIHFGIVMIFGVRVIESQFSVVQQIPQEIKLRDIISRSTLNNSNQAQERNHPDVLVRQSESK